MKVLLYSGNEEVQDGIIQSVKGTREEKLFISFKKRLQLASIQFKEIRDLRLQLDKKQKSKKKLVSYKINPIIVVFHLCIYFTG